MTDKMERNEAEQALISRVSDRLQQRIAQEPRPDEATRMKMIEAMRANGADPAYIHAFEKTGLLVFQETMHLIEPADLEAWHQAYEEYGRPGKGVRPESPEEGEL